MSDQSNKIPQTEPRFSATFDTSTMSEIRRAAATGIYDIRGGGAKREAADLAGGGQVRFEQRGRKRQREIGRASCRERV